MNKQEYLDKVNKTKDIVVPSGITFKIQTIKGRTLAMQGNSAFFTSIAGETGSSPEKNQQLVMKMTPEQRREQLQYMNNLMCLSIIEPTISLTESQEYLCIEDLSDEDYFFLLNEISDFSLGSSAEKPKKFLNEQSAATV